MITRRFKTLFSQSFKNPFIYNPHFSFSYSLRYSSQTLKTPEISNAISEYFVREHQFSSEVASKAASSLSHLKSPKKCYAVLSFFKGFGFSNSDLQNIVESKSAPKVLCANVDNTLKPKIKTFQDFGFSKDDIVCILTANKWSLFGIANNRILPSLLVLKNVLGSVDLVAKLLKLCAWFIRNDLERDFIPNIEYLKSCGVQMEQLTQHLFRSPRLFLLRPENLKKVVEKVDEMRFNRESKMFIYAIASVSSMSDVVWEKKLELFRSLGFTQDQIVLIFQKDPTAFSKSEGKIKEVVQVITGSQLFDSSDIVKSPRVFKFSVEGRLKPRLRVLEILRERNLILRQPSLSVVCETDKYFIEKFVTPYLDKLKKLSQQPTPKDWPFW